MGLQVYGGGGTGTEGGDGKPGAPGSPGVSVTSAQLNDAGHLVLALSDGNTADAGLLPGFKAAAVDGATLVLTRLDGTTVSLGNVQGPKGNTGTRGADGITPALSIGRVDALASGATPTATLGGTAAAPVLNLGVPAGPKGDAGSRGQTGVTPQLRIGALAYGPQGGAGISGTAEEPVLNLTLPQGEPGPKGDAGAQGDVGPTPALSIGTVTGNATGAPAMASIGGTPANPTLNLGLPKGETGATGRSVTAMAVNSSNVLTATLHDNVTNTDSTVTVGTISGGGGSGTSNSSSYVFAAVAGANLSTTVFPVTPGYYRVNASVFTNSSSTTGKTASLNMAFTAGGVSTTVGYAYAAWRYAGSSGTLNGGTSLYGSSGGNTEFQLFTSSIGSVTSGQFSIEVVLQVTSAAGNVYFYESSSSTALTLLAGSHVTLTKL